MNESRYQHPWQPVEDLTDWNIETLDRALYTLQDDDQPFLPKRLAEYDQITNARLAEKRDLIEKHPETADTIRDEVRDLFVGSAFEHLVAEMLAREIDGNSHRYLSPYRAAKWCQTLAVGGEIVTHPFGTYSLKDDSPVFDGIIQPIVYGKSPIICVEITTHISLNSIQKKLSHFRNFQHRYQDSMQLELHFFTPIRNDSEDTIDLFLPEPRMITEVPIYRSDLRAVIDKYLHPSIKHQEKKH